MKKILIITYYFPPRPAIGSIRLGGLAKYLPEFGWEPIILTAELPSEPGLQLKVIQTQYYDVLSDWKKKLGFGSDKIPQQQSEINSHRRSRHKLTKYISSLVKEIIAYPDCMKGWLPFAIKAGDKLLRQENIDAIISSSNPVTCHLIAKRLKARSHVPWVADLRDIWTQDDDYSDNHSLFRRLVERRLELKTLSKANALVTVSAPLVERLKVLHKTESVYEIPNGFDPAEVKPISPSGLTDKFTITYTGSLYNCLRDPSNLFKAVQDLVSEGSINPHHIQIRFYGSREECLEKLINSYKLQDIVKHYGFMSREIILEKQRESQLLLLLNWANYSAIGTYTGKLFEYFAALRPILSIGKTGGVIEELLNKTNSGIHASDINDVKNFLKKCYSEYKSRGEVTYVGQRAEIDKYNHREMARKFSEILNSLNK